MASNARGVFGEDWETGDVVLVSSSRKRDRAAVDSWVVLWDDILTFRDDPATFTINDGNILETSSSSSEQLNIARGEGQHAAKLIVRAASTEWAVRVLRWR